MDAPLQMNHTTIIYRQPTFLGETMWRWIYRYFFQSFVLELFDHLALRVEKLESIQADQGKDVKRLYNVTTGTQALENLLEKRVAMFMSQTQSMEDSIKAIQRSLTARSIEYDSKFDKSDCKILELRDQCIDIKNKLNFTLDRIEVLRYDTKRTENEISSLKIPRDSQGRFAKKTRSSDD